jgi:hypothetical protein
MAEMMRKNSTQQTPSSDNIVEREAIALARSHSFWFDVPAPASRISAEAGWVILVTRK